MDVRPSATGALSTDFQVGIEQLLDGGVDAAIFRRVVSDGPGHADGRGSRNEHQGDHGYSKGQFHGTPPKDAGRTCAIQLNGYGLRWA
jgi:hypothetical protein